MPQFDDFEIRMLDILQRDGRKPVSEVAQQIGLSTTPCARRFAGKLHRRRAAHGAAGHQPADSPDFNEGPGCV